MAPIRMTVFRIAASRVLPA